MNESGAAGGNADLAGSTKIESAMKKLEDI